jgi:hypothetical protein
MELYRIPDDPMELNNLAGSEPARVKGMADKLRSWQQKLPPGPMDATAGQNSWKWPGAK